jgi:hypothetical protein
MAIPLKESRITILSSWLTGAARSVEGRWMTHIMLVLVFYYHMGKRNTILCSPNFDPDIFFEGPDNCGKYVNFQGRRTVRFKFFSNQF